RNETTLPTQSLFLLNSDFLIEQSQAFARVVLNDTKLKETDRINLAYQRAFNRVPESFELQRTLTLLQDLDQSLQSEISQTEQRQLVVWSTLCQALLTTSEFRYVD
ncbi:MAG: DUF1553 domain-containing protein, partial [Planctomycetaceae bacterium]|nr:DUF1553 domain-containing protein [Planctomycetaceae bacterium]